MSKMHLALVDQSLEKSMKSWKKIEQDRHISSNDINKELNIDYKKVLNVWRRLDKKKLDI